MAIEQWQEKYNVVQQKQHFFVDYVGIIEQHNQQNQHNHVVYVVQVEQ